MLGEEDGNLELISLSFQLSIGIYNINQQKWDWPLTVNNAQKLK